MSGRLFLCGGGNETQTFQVDEVFLQNVNKILYVPVAWPSDDFDGCLLWFTRAMFSHKSVKIEMLTDLNKDVDLKQYGAVYIGGGNTFKLLKRIKESSFDKKLLRYYNAGGIVYGGSAGAIIWGRDINTALLCYDRDVNAVALKDTSGLDVLGGIDVQVHYHDNESTGHQEYIAKTGRSIVAIPEESALLVENGKMKVVGTKPITMITETSLKSYPVGGEVRLHGGGQKVKK